MPQTPPTQTRSIPWSLIVVRGRDRGKVLALLGNEVILGNALDGAPGLDLRDQEAGSPRRMAGRQAILETRGADLFIRDLDSPGGTFVNRQRLLGSQARQLQPGDFLQIGGVLLRVAVFRESPSTPRPGPPPIGAPPPSSPPPAAGPGRPSEPYAIGGTVACRTWDDFLVVAAQRWNDLRDDLVSGRIADHLRRIGRLDLLPRPEAGQSADEQLDQWLGRLPVSRSSAPELDVHPDRLEARASGGTTRHNVRITNVGYRLLRSTARVEPAGCRWVRILPPYDGRSFVTIEETELPIEVEVPEGQGGSLVAEIVLESNGGTRRIAVAIGSPERPPPLPGAFGDGSGTTDTPLFRSMADGLTRLAPSSRIAAGIAIALAVRLTVLASSLLPIAPPGGRSLPALAVLCAAIGGIGGLVKGWRRSGDPVDAATAGIAAGLCGVLAAAVLHALVRTFEQPLAGGSPPIWAAAPIWAAVGATLAGVTCLLLPFRGPSGEMPS